jgi:hypothetical protein
MSGPSRSKAAAPSHVTVVVILALVLPACSSDAPIGPATDASDLPTLAVQRNTSRTTFTLREQNPCNLEPVTFQVTFILTQMEAGSPGSEKLLRVGETLVYAGVGDFGTIYSGREHSNVVFLTDGERTWGKTNRVVILRGSAPGTTFLQVTLIRLDRKTGDISLVVGNRRCLGPGGGPV